MSDYAYLSQEVMNLKDLVYASLSSNHQPDYSAQAAKMVQKSESALKEENAQLRGLIAKMQADIRKLDNDDRKIVKEAKESFALMAEATGKAIDDRCKEEERDLKAHVASTLGQVHSDVVSAKNASAMNIQMAADYLVGQAAFLCSKI